MAYKIWTSVPLLEDVYYQSYVPFFTTCYSSYSFGIEFFTSITTNVTVSVFWTGDLGGGFSNSIIINSGSTCGSNIFYTYGDVNCVGENVSNVFTIPIPNPPGNQNYIDVGFYPDFYYPC